MIRLEVTPSVDDRLEQALRDAIGVEQALARPDEPAWQRAARAEAVERDESYAFSPRSTRGATRA